MFRKLLFLGATVWLGKKGYDALMAAQTDAADFVDTAPSVGAAGLTDPADAGDETTPLNPVLDPVVAAQLQDVKHMAAEGNSLA